jgi:peptidoglycan/xylan/chitin deacetylase (PgdA/CDA1 family)
MSRAVILMYHIVDEPRTEREARFCVKPQAFAQQMGLLRDAGYVPVTLDQIVDSLVDGASIPSNAIAVTFDDGFAATCAHAVPVLQRYSIPSTMFAVSGRLARANDWMYERGFPRRAIMSAGQMRELDAAGVMIGSHTSSHARLTELPARVVADELAESKRQLEDVLGKPVRHFAYPYGLFDRSVRDAVEQAGYRGACSTRAGFNRKGEDPFLLRRIDVFGGDALWQFKQKMRYGINEATRSYPFRYYAGRAASRLGLGQS